mmetsp:Transcript_14804/g.46537  ORF Transcript_14804/g.46537 Transcript_14804/m.46537 type:complete len:207 (-) Transcript_14804:157-777(-)
MSEGAARRRARGRLPCSWCLLRSWCLLHWIGGGERRLSLDERERERGGLAASRARRGRQQGSGKAFGVGQRRGARRTRVKRLSLDLEVSLCPILKWGQRWLTARILSRSRFRPVQMSARVSSSRQTYQERPSRVTCSPSSRSPSGGASDVATKERSKASCSRSSPSKFRGSSLHNMSYRRAASSGVAKRAAKSPLAMYFPLAVSTP